ncbi:MAG: hypothetical protein HFI95_14175 [Lachnospiraceae bacterium]|jgi:hypothetical protein|nr:hypothetical protein [Lachnospiraceae bacterium]
MTGADECLLIRVKADKKSMLGRLACIRKLVDRFSMEECELDYMVSYGEKGATEPDQKSVAKTITV